MVVPVFMISCQVSEYLNTGPVIPHMMITAIAVKNAAELPVAAVAAFENRSKKFFFLPAIVLIKYGFITNKKRQCFHIGAFCVGDKLVELD